jgi:hypothetical protein
MKIRIDRVDLDDLMVIIEHPMGELTVSFRDWEREGPGPRSRLRPTRAFLASSGAEVPLSVIPLRFQNGRGTRLLRCLHLVKNPWAKGA